VSAGDGLGREAPESKPPTAASHIASAHRRMKLSDGSPENALEAIAHALIACAISLDGLHTMGIETWPGSPR
jgi:hypothetical protein